MSSHPAPPRNAPVGLAEDEILRRGLETFAELGYEGASVREIAKRLGVSHNFLHDRYGSKLSFWQAVIRSAMRPRRDELIEVAGRAPSDGEMLVALVHDLYRGAAATPDVTRIIADESSRDTDRLTYLHDEILAPFFAVLSPLVDRLVKAGAMPPVPAEVVFFAITGPALALTHDALAVRLGRPSTMTDQQLRDRADATAALILGGLSARP